MRIESRDLSWLADLLRGLYASRTERELSAITVAALSRRFEVAFGCWEEITSGGYSLHAMTTHRTLPMETAACLHDHPMMPWVTTMPPLTHVRSRFTRRQFENTDYFDGVARVVGYNDHVILRAQSWPSSVTISLCRDRFRSGEIALLELLQPHLETAWQRFSAAAVAPAEALGQPIELAHDLRPRDLASAQVQRLRMYYPRWRNTAALPDEVLAWVRETEVGLWRRPLAVRPKILQAEAGAGILLLRYHPLVNGGVELRGMEHFRPRSGPVGWSLLSLREQDVARWVIAGKRDEEIGLILGVSRKTVSKHVERVLAKLGVRNRVAVGAALR